MSEILNGKYKKLKQEPIGEGTQAKVFLCEDIITKKKYFTFLNNFNKASCIQLKLIIKKRCNKNDYEYISKRRIGNNEKM